MTDPRAIREIEHLGKFTKMTRIHKRDEWFPFLHIHVSEVFLQGEKWQTIFDGFGDRWMGRKHEVSSKSELFLAMLPPFLNDIL